MPAMCETQWHRVQRLVERWSEPILALRAYETVIDALAPSHPDCGVYFADYVLHCNAFALHELERGRVEHAMDYVRLALDRFAAQHAVRLDLDALSQAAVRLPRDDLVAAVQEHHATQVLYLPDEVEPTTLALLSLTLHNWASLELSVGHVTRAHIILALQTHCMRAGDVFGPQWGVVAALDGAVWDVVESNYEAAEQALRPLIAQLEQGSLVAAIAGTPMSEDGGGAVRPQSNRSSSSSSPSEWHTSSARAEQLAADTALLHGLCLFTLGVAQQYTQCAAAGDSFALALAQLTALRQGDDDDDDDEGGDEKKNTAATTYRAARLRAVTAVDAAQTLMTGYIAELQAKAEVEMQERQAAQEATHRRPHRPAAHGHNKRGSVPGAARGRQAGHAMPPLTVVPPAMHAALRSYIRSHGLPMLCLSVMGVREAMYRLRLGTRHFVSPLDRAAAAWRVLGAVMCAETPMGWALRVQRVLQQPTAASHRSVWSAGGANGGQEAPYVMAVLAARTTQGPSRAMTMLEDARRPSRILRTHLAPRPFAQDAMESAQSSVTAVVQLLGHRLQMLLKLERNYEDCWQATRRVKNALKAYYVTQALIRFKHAELARRRAEAARRDGSARIITRFMRRVLQERPSQHGYCSAAALREAQAAAAAVTLQRYARRWLAAQEYRRRRAARAHYLRQVTLVQAVYRGGQARQSYAQRCAVAQARRAQDVLSATRAYAAVCVQRVYRGHRARLAYYRAVGEGRRALLHHLHDSRHYYATVVQKVVRGRLVRRVWGRAVDACCRRARNAFRTALLERCCVRIQRCYRRHRARRVCAALRHVRLPSDTSSHAAAATAHDAEADDVSVTAVRAARKIQGLCRVHLARQKAAQLRHSRVLAAAARSKAVFPLLNLSACEF